MFSRLESELKPIEISREMEIAMDLTLNPTNQAVVDVEDGEVNESEGDEDQEKKMDIELIPVGEKKNLSYIERKFFFPLTNMIYNILIFFVLKTFMMINQCFSHLSKRDGEWMVFEMFKALMLIFESSRRKFSE